MEAKGSQHCVMHGDKSNEGSEAYLQLVSAATFITFAARDEVVLVPFVNMNPKLVTAL